ncbi:two pore domain potassium channel family protein [Candidatus Woesearchaeota archaeon]|nr:two pore domain potassium channel family protein [Candidatus Woesearchaeota archaeon]
MKKPNRLESKINHFHRLNFSLVDKIGFGGIFLFWIGFVLLCGLLYFFLAGESAYLVSMVSGVRITSFLNSLYFSVVAATTTGFGDIVPEGIFKLVASLEVIVSLLVVAVVTSKFISLKQDVILEELYEITFVERVNRMRSSLLVFRKNIHSLIHKIDDGLLKNRDVQHLYVTIATFKETIYEINSLFTNKRHNDFVRQINSVDVSLMTNSMIYSFQRLKVLLKLLEENDCDWKYSKMLFFLEKALQAEEDYFDLVKKSGLLSKEEYSNFEEERNKIIPKIRRHLVKPEIV